MSDSEDVLDDDRALDDDEELSQDEQVKQLSELVSYIAEQLVDSPDEVEVKSIDADRSVIFELLVARDDLGKVIGRDGRTARAIRAILSAAGADLDRRPILDIIE